MKNTRYRDLPRITYSSIRINFEHILEILKLHLSVFVCFYRCIYINHFDLSVFAMGHCSKRKLHFGLFWFKDVCYWYTETMIFDTAIKSWGPFRLVLIWINPALPERLHVKLPSHWVQYIGHQKAAWTEIRTIFNNCIETRNFIATSWKSLSIKSKYFVKFITKYNRAIHLFPWIQDRFIL